MTFRICWLRRFADDDCFWRSDGNPDPAHLIPRQRLRLAGLSDDEQMDPRILVPACRHHHDAFDNKRLELELADYPEPARNFAFEHGFAFISPRVGWIHLRR